MEIQSSYEEDDIYANAVGWHPQHAECTERTDLKKEKTRKMFIFAVCLFLILVALSPFCIGISVLYHNKLVSYQLLSELNANITATLMIKEQRASETERHFEELKVKYQQNQETLSACKANKNSRQCENGWTSFGWKCYYFSTSELTWEQCRDDCVRKGGHLVVITSRAEHNFLYLQIEETHWIGLNDLETEGEWMWVNNQPLKDKLSFWFSEGHNEPDNWKKEDPSGENCAAMGYEDVHINKWFDASCRTLKKCICEN